MDRCEKRDKKKHCVIIDRIYVKSENFRLPVLSPKTLSMYGISTYIRVVFYIFNVGEYTVYHALILWDLASIVSDPQCITHGKAMLEVQQPYLRGLANHGFLTTHTSPGMILQVSSIDHGSVENETQQKNLYIKGNPFFWGDPGFSGPIFQIKRRSSCLRFRVLVFKLSSVFAILPLKNLTWNLAPQNLEVWEHEFPHGPGHDSFSQLNCTS